MQIPVRTLNNGVQVPMIGFGTWQLADPNVCYDAVTRALEAGYRSIDTAAMYHNEEAVGRAIKDSGIPREELFITTKLARDDRSYDKALAAFDVSLEKLGLDYVDLYLIHWPGTEERFVPSWKAFGKIYEQKRARAIGLSNFLQHHLQTLEAETGILPASDQLEFHPYLAQSETEDYCKAHNILVEAWSPLMSGKEALGDAVIVNIAKRHGKSPAQVILRWHTQCGRRVIPRSVTPARIAENLQIFDFSLSLDEIAALNALCVKNVRTGPDPDTFLD
nr:aldo/keto reductase [Maliibacterium massiliense]